MKAICPDPAVRMSATDTISVSGSPCRRPPTSSAISRTFFPTIYIDFVEKSVGSAVALGCINRSLKEELDPLDMAMTVVLEAPEHLCRLTVEKTQVGEIDGNDIIRFHLKVSHDLFKQKGIVKQ